MANKVQEIRDYLVEDELARQIREMYDRFRMLRRGWEEEKQELRNYIFATDTTKTTNNQLPWKNKTTIPKICQIRDNLHANYSAALFANDNWFRWDAGEISSATKAKRTAIEAYIRTKINNSNFYQVMSELLYDYIDYGNCIADVEFVRITHKDKAKEEVVDYVGPRVVRHNPLDVVFNITAASFDQSPKITRCVRSLGELEKELTTRPDLLYNRAKVAQLKDIRQKLADYSANDLHKAIGYRIDGFGDLREYYGSSFVDILEFEGDIYDPTTNTLYENRLITVADRHIVLRNEPLDTWQGITTKRHTGWRYRPGNLLAMGPLDNLVGMQYRIDHLENMKADIFDLIAHPVQVISGQVDDYVWEPGAKIFAGAEGRVDIVEVDSAALNADFQIAALEQKMEEMAGAPKQALGFRTPGEKTAFEVQTLENAAGRIFQHKITQFETHFLEPLLNTMLEVARRNLDSTDVIKIVDDDLGIEQFLKVTKDDISAKGRLRPLGSRHFGARSQLLSTLNVLYSSGILQDEQVKAHISGKRVAQMVENLLGLERFGLVRDNVRIVEAVETQQLAQQANSVAGNPPTPAEQAAIETASENEV